MNSNHSEARKRVLETTAEMLGRHGLNSTSIREMARRAEFPLGSIYHHFPDGKEQIVAEAVELIGAQIAARLDQLLQSGAVAGINNFLGMWRSVLLQNDFQIGCPVLAVAVEEPTDKATTSSRRVAAEAFGQWEGKIISALVTQGLEPAEAAGRAILIVAAVEGAIALSRASRSIEPWDRVAYQIAALLPKS